MENGRDIWVYAQISEGMIEPVVFELLGLGQLLAEPGDKVCAVLPGWKRESCAKELISRGADVVYLAENSLLERYTAEGYTMAVSELAERLKPDMILFGGTDEGREVAPRVAVRLQTGLTVDCTQLRRDKNSGKLHQIRPAFGERLMAEIVTKGDGPQLCTVRPGQFKPMEKYSKAKTDKIGSVIKEKLELSAFKTKVKMLKSSYELCSEISLSEAEVVIGGGMGIGGKEGFELLKELAKVLHGSVGGTRAAVNEGFIGHACMIGQTGVIIAPKIYIACGVSGAVQHMLGVTGADCIIAVNNNPDAPVFKEADYGVCADYREFVPELINRIKRQRRDNGDKRGT